MTRTAITISGLRLYGYHGVGAQERRVGAWFRYDLHLRYDASRAIDSDSVADALNYAEVAETVARVAATPSDLLEHLAGRIRRELTAAYPAITGGSVAVTKEAPPVARSFEATFTIEW